MTVGNSIDNTRVVQEAASASTGSAIYVTFVLSAAAPLRPHEGVHLALILWLIFSAQLWDHAPRTLGVMTAAGFRYVLGVIPYLYAMSYGEASSVMPQMLMAPLFTLLPGYALLRPPNRSGG